VTAGGRTQVRYLSSGMHTMGQNSRILHFGLGPNATAEKIEVLWPTGKTQALTDVKADQVLKIVEHTEP
jgi:hypothetical protein